MSLAFPFIALLALAQVEVDTATRSSTSALTLADTETDTASSAAEASEIPADAADSGEVPPDDALSMPGGTARIYGRVLERGSRRPIADAEIAYGEEVVLTDSRGRYAIEGLAAGEHTLMVSEYEHEPDQLKVKLTEGQEKRVSFFLKRPRFNPYEVIVKDKLRPQGVTTHRLRMEEIITAPGTYSDPLKAVQNLPGTARTPIGLGGLIIRGSRPEESLVFLDGHEVPMLFHFAGLASVVNADTLSALEFSPSNFGVRFGRATGGVVEMETRVGKAAPHGYLDLDILDVTFLAEAKIGDGGLLLSGRRSWVDTFLVLIYSGLGDDLEVAPRAYDYQARFEHPLFGGDSELMLIGADDKFEIIVGEAENNDRPRFVHHFAFHRAQLSWKRDFGDGWRTDISGVVGLNIETEEIGDARASDLTRTTGHVRADVEKKWSSLKLAAGLDVEAGNYELRTVGPPPLGPDAVVVNPNPRPDVTSGVYFGDGGDARGTLQDINNRDHFSPAAWMEATWDPWEAVRIVPGVRADYHGLLRRATLDPRMNAAVKVSDTLLLVGGVGLFSGSPPLALLSDRFGNPDLLPERALQASVGAKIKLPFDLELGLDLYTKELSKLAVFTENPGADGPVYASEGDGNAIGAELLLRRQFGQQLSGWLAYSLSRSMRTIRVGGERQLSAYDQPHVITLMLSYRTKSDWTLSMRGRFASGSPIAPVEGTVFSADTGEYFPVLADEPTERLPSFFQLDARIDKEWVFQDVILTAFIDVQNVTNRDNAEGYQYNFDYTERVEYDGVPILPTAGVRIQF